MSPEEEKQAVRDAYKRRCDAANRAATGGELPQLQQAIKPKHVLPVRPQSKVKK